LSEPIWSPGAERVRRSNMTAFLQRVRDRRPAGAEAVFDFPSLYRWSVARPDAFWPEVWEFCSVVAEEPPEGKPWDEVVLGLDRMAPPDPVLGPRWFIGARLNFAENLLRFDDDREALVFWNEQGRQRSLTYRDLGEAVAGNAAALREHGIGPGDRVAGFLPNLPETVIAMLAAASLGAIWSSCSPDFGAGGVLDRFGQIAPRVLFCADGYRYAGKTIDSLARVREVRQRIPAIERVVVVPYLSERPDLGGIEGAVLWEDWGKGRNGGTAATFRRLPFDHPLYIMYSSGTTGLPKCMVHGAGGTLLQHLKELVLHTDLTRRDRIFYFTTCGWMMWNWLVSSLAAGATVVLYDGAPLAPPAVLWDLVERERVTVFGTSAKYLALAEKEGLRPGRPSSRPAARWRHPASTTSTGTSSRMSTSPASAGARTSSPASPWGTRSPRSGGESSRPGAWAWPSRSSTRAAGRSGGGTASWCAPGRSPACRWPSGTTRRGPGTARRTSTSIPGSGGTATGPGSPTTTGW
jgi:acetoacetyl-CoA synthetase